MGFFLIVAKNLNNPPLWAFLGGIIAGFSRIRVVFHERLSKTIMMVILFVIGLKGGAAIAREGGDFNCAFLKLTAGLIIWAFIQPFVSYWLVRRTAQLDRETASAIAASFGSVSVMTFAAGTSFLEYMKIPYQSSIIGTLAILEVPAIITAVFIARLSISQKISMASLYALLRKCIFNLPILSLIGGLGASAAAMFWLNIDLSSLMKKPFPYLLALFLFDLGVRVYKQKDFWNQISWPLVLFSIYTPLFSACLGLFMSHLLGIDLGSAILSAVLAASASYIAVPAAMRITLPNAKEGIYLPMSLGIAFPFNIVVGIPIYYFLACKLLNF